VVRGEDLGQAVEELESGEAQGGAACQVGLGQEIENLVGTTADQVKTVESERGPGTVADQPFEAFAVGGLDPDAGVEAEAAPVLPVEHIPGLVGFQEAVAPKMPQDPGANRVLEALQELAGEAGGLVEVETGLGVGGTGVRVLVQPLEEPIDHAHMKVEMGVEAGAEAVQEADRAHGGGSWGGGTGFPQGAPEGAEQDVKDGAGGAGPVMKEGPEAFGHGKDELADGYMGEDVVHQVGRRMGHALGPARGTAPPALA